MLGIIRRRKPIILAHWYVPLMDFQSDTEQFYKAIDEDCVTRRVPELTIERIDFKTRGFLSAKRGYLRLRRERVVLDVCSAPFGTSWWFSLRSAVLPRHLYWGEVYLAILGLLGFCALYWQLYGPVLGGIVLASSIVFLLVVFLTARSWATLDEFLIYLPVVGALYEAYFRRDTYQMQDQRLMFADIVTSIVRAKVVEFCTAGGVTDITFVKVSAPDQILSRKELANYLEAEGEKER